MEDREAYTLSKAEAYTLSKAARILDTTEGALRQRVRRGTLESYKEEGRVYVYIPRTDTVQDDVHIPESQTLMSEVQARVELLEQELERAHERDRETRRLLAAALERIPPQLEAPQEASEAAETVEEEPERAEPRPTTVESQEGAHRPWWKFW